MPRAGNSGWWLLHVPFRVLLACFYFKANIPLLVTTHAVQAAWRVQETGKEVLTALTKGAQSQGHAVLAQTALLRGLL